MDNPKIPKAQALITSLCPTTVFINMADQSTIEPSPVMQQKAIMPNGRMVLKAKKLSVLTLDFTVCGSCIWSFISFVDAHNMGRIPKSPMMIKWV